MYMVTLNDSELKITSGHPLVFKKWKIVSGHPLVFKK